MKTSSRSFLALILSIFLPWQAWAESSSECSSDSEAIVIYVNVKATGKDNGTSWKNAFTDLQSALDEAASIDGPKQIWVAKGTYYPTRVDPFAPRSLTPTFLIPDLTELIGGFKGDEECVKQRTLKQPSKTILSGLSTPQANHVVTLDKVSVTIDGVTIRDGLATNGSGFADRENGGGIFIWSGNTILNNVSLIENQAISSVNGGGTGLGGGLYASRRVATDPAPVITMKNMLIDSNLANRLGGGMFFAVATVDMFDSIFKNNSVLRPFANTFAQGGGFQISDGIASVTHCIFKNNSADSNASGGSGLGGAIYAFNTTSTVVTIKDSQFLNNFAKDQGGALYSNDGARMYVFDSLLDGNSIHGSSPTADAGGAVKTLGADFAMLNCTVSNNHADLDAGALRLGGGTVLISNCKIFKNTCDGAGGAITVFATVAIDNSVIENNSAGTVGGGIQVKDGSNLLLLDSTVQNNRALSGGGIFNNGITTIEESIISHNKATFVSDNTISGLGGGIMNQLISTPTTGSGLVSILNSEIKNNEAEIRGGGVYTDQNTSFRVQNGLFLENIAGSDGGAIFATALSFLTSRNTFVKNTAENGGAIFYTNPLTTLFTVNIAQNNFYKNKGSVSAGAIALVDATSSDVNIFDNTFHKNRSPQGVALLIVNSSTDVVGNSFKGCGEDCCIFYLTSSINDKVVPADIDTYIRFLNCCDHCESRE